MRAWATVIQRDLQVDSLIADMYAGRPVVYTTFLAYDEVAHHSGIERPETLATLRQVDRQMGRIAAAARRRAARIPPGRALRPRPVPGRDVPRPLRELARAARAREHERGSARQPGRADRARGICRGRIRRPSERGAGVSRRLGRRDRQLAPRGCRSSCGACRADFSIATRQRPERPGCSQRSLARGRGDGLGLPRTDLLPARARDA